jgi:hypothetical protein
MPTPEELWHNSKTSITLTLSMQLSTQASPPTATSGKGGSFSTSHAALFAAGLVTTAGTTST